MMFQFAHIAPITLPLEDPILKFLLILIIILAAPLLLNKLKIPYLLGLIIAGAVIGPHGLNLVLRDSSIILSGTAGLLYIMFLSGLDMDTSDFKKSGWRSLVFGLYTFCVPLALGILAGYYIMGFSIYSSILLAGLFASQTLIAYPIVSKLGIHLLKGLLHRPLDDLQQVLEMIIKRLPGDPACLHDVFYRDLVDILFVRQLYKRFGDQIFHIYRHRRTSLAR